MPGLAVIALNYKDYIEKYGGDFIKSLRKSTVRFDLIVVDNQTSRASRELIKKIIPEAEILTCQENLGFAGGNNLGFKTAMDRGYDYVLCLNLDTIVKPDFIEKALKAFNENDSIAAIQSRLMLWPDKEKVNSLGNKIHFLGFGYSHGCGQTLDEFSGRELRNHEIAYPSGAALFLKTAVLKQIGLFEEDFFMYHEDLELGWRIRLAGYRINLAYDSVVYHKYEFGRSIKKIYWMERNRYLTIFENYKLATIILIIPALIFTEIVSLVFSIFSGAFKEKLKVYVFFLKLKNWQRVSRYRKQKQALRKVKDKDLLKIFVGKIEFQPIDSLFLKISNFFTNLYFQLLKLIVWW